MINTVSLHKNVAMSDSLQKSVARSAFARLFTCIRPWYLNPPRSRNTVLMSFARQSSAIFFPTSSAASLLAPSFVSWPSSTPAVKDETAARVCPTASSITYEQEAVCLHNAHYMDGNYESDITGKLRSITKPCLAIYMIVGSID